MLCLPNNGTTSIYPDIFEKGKQKHICDCKGAPATLDQF